MKFLTHHLAVISHNYVGFVSCYICMVAACEELNWTAVCERPCSQMLRSVLWSYICPCPCYEGVWGERTYSPHILQLGSRWRWVVNFMPWLFTSRKEPQYPL